MTVTEYAHAKINLSLDVVERRDDGYHELYTVMQSVSLCDTLRATRTGDALSLYTSDATLVNKENLVYRAAQAYFRASGEPFGVELALEKRIPMQAGLGGGSADAAAALRALNRLDGQRFSMQELCEIGATVGADVPFCVYGGTRLCRGIGERMEAIPSGLGAHAVIVMADEGVSTPWAFAALDARYASYGSLLAVAEHRHAQLLPAIQGGDLCALAPLLYNRFEEVILQERPLAQRAKDDLVGLGASVALMSGSGPAVFGLFEDGAAAKHAAAVLSARSALALCCTLI